MSEKHLLHLFLCMTVTVLLFCSAAFAEAEGGYEASPDAAYTYEEPYNADLDAAAQAYEEPAAAEVPAEVPADPPATEPAYIEPEPAAPPAEVQNAPAENAGSWDGTATWQEPYAGGEHEWHDPGYSDEEGNYSVYEEYTEYEYDETEDPALIDEVDKDEHRDSVYLYPEYTIKDFPVIKQLPELPTGCEITALTMILQYYGYPADKEDLAAHYLPKTELEIYTGEDGVRYGPDLYNYFGGDPFDSGTICGPGAIVTAANTYLADVEEEREETGGRRVLHEAEDLTGSTLEDVYALIRQDMPVLVWVTIDMERRMKPEDSWVTEDGEAIDWTTNDHGAVLIGYTTEFVYIADPLEGIVEYGRQEFERVFRSRGKKCVALTLLS